MTWDDLAVSHRGTRKGHDEQKGGFEQWLRHAQTHCDEAMVRWFCEQRGRM